MHPIRKIAIIGSGAVGTYYGARLAQHGNEVHFLLRSDYPAVVQNGWTIRSCDGDFTLAPDRINIYDDVRRMPPADLVLVCLKTVSNHQFQPLIEPILHDQSVILTLQNGLGNEQELARLFGPDRVMGGMAFVCLNRLEPGLVHHIDQGWIQIGELAPGITPRGQAIARLFTESAIDCELLANLMVGRWDKLVWNVPFNGLGAALDLTTDKLIGTEAGLEMVKGIMREVLATAEALGYPLPSDSIEKKINHTRTMGAYRTSMQIDRQVRRPMEVEAILGAPVAAAEHIGLAVPRMKWLHSYVNIVNSANLDNL